MNTAEVGFAKDQAEYRIKIGLKNIIRKREYEVVICSRVDPILE